MYKEDFVPMEFGIDQFEVIRVPADGDCFYHAFIRGLGLNTSPSQLRNYVAEQLEASDKLYQDLIDEWKDLGVRDASKLSKGEVLYRIRYRHEWATATIIHILADAFNVKVTVYKKVKDRYYPQVFPYGWTYDPSKRKFARDIYIYNEGGHFDLLQRKQRQYGGGKVEPNQPSNVSFVVGLAMFAAVLFYL